MLYFVSLYKAWVLEHQLYVAQGLGSLQSLSVRGMYILSSVQQGVIGWEDMEWCCGGIVNVCFDLFAGVVIVMVLDSMGVIRKVMAVTGVEALIQKV